MSKKNKIPEPQPQAEALQPPPAPARPAEEKVPASLIWIFWLGVAAALITARALNASLPGVSESVIERWVMVGFAAFLGLFLLKLK